MAFTPKVWANSPATTTPLSAAALTDLESLVTSYNAGSGGGAVSIATSESRTNVVYGTLTTPDQVTGVVLPTNGLIAVWYQAAWQESVSGAARANLFLGANEIELSGIGSGFPQTQGALLGGTPARSAPLATYSMGLVSGSPAANTGADVTTGQVVGALGVVSPTGGSVGGPCYIFAAAGTYTVSVQFKASSGSVTASNRQLWVQTLAFS